MVLVDVYDPISGDDHDKDLLIAVTFKVQQLRTTQRLSRNR